jgi:signal transduction histidine kinase
MRRPGWILASGAAVGTALLVLLGTLQVRWLDQVAQTVAAQKRATLYRQGTALATDLERELTRAFFWFHVDDLGEERPLDQLVRERWQSWRQAVRHPGLLAAVWLAEQEPGTADLRLRHLGPSGLLEPAAWPAALEELRGSLREQIRMAGLLPPSDGGGLWLAIPADPPGRPGALIVLELEQRTLARELLPALADEHLGRGQEGGPIIARLDDGEGRLLFAWPAGADPVRTGQHDPIALLGVRPDLATPALLAGMQPPLSWPRDLHIHHTIGGETAPPRAGGGTPAGLVVGFGPGPGLAMPPPMFARQLVGGRMVTGPPPGLPPGFPRGARSRSFGGSPPGRLGGPGLLGMWRLSLAFAAGPVDDVVTSLRRRNLAFGFSILALLGGAIAALTLAVRRAHALAEQQRQFTATISHELRTPLAVIGSAAENLRDGTVEDAARVREYGAMIHTESRRLGGMLDHALRLAAGQDLGDQLVLQPVDLRAVVDTALDSCGQELRARGGQLERTDPTEPPIAEADPEALRQAVENVVGNALKYGGEPPRLTVRIDRVQAARGPELRIVVEDRGIGIPPDELGRVFEPFFRGREALARQIRGTGLGLALVARVMRAHGGAVSVTSTPGEGSVFVLRLPAQKVQRA